MLNLRETLTGDIQRMASVTRYSQMPVIKRENVAEHSWYVAMYCYAIGIDLQRRGISVSMEKLLRRAIVHDVDEVASGDLVRNFKFALPGLASVLKEASKHLLLKMMQSLGLPIESACKDWEQAKAADLEGTIIRLCDFLSVVSYLHQEVKMGNSLMLPVVRDARRYIEDDFVGNLDPNKILLKDYVAEALALLAELSPSSPLTKIGAA